MPYHDIWIGALALQHNVEVVSRDAHFDAMPGVRRIGWQGRKAATVLRPSAEQRGLVTWEQLAAYAAEEWYPSRIASVTASWQKSPDELRGGDGLRLVTRAAEDIEMPVFSDDVIRL